MPGHTPRCYAWVDIETTGTDPEKDEILEIGIVLTKPNLEEICRIHSLVHFEGRMTQWAFLQHAKTGLLDLCRESSIRIHTAEQVCGVALMHELARSGNDQEPLLCGSSVHFERSFLRRHMPGLIELFHYRSVDVSALREDARACGFALEDPEGFESKHRVMSDIDDSIALLKRIRREVYRDHTQEV